MTGTYPRISFQTKHYLVPKEPGLSHGPYQVWIQGIIENIDVVFPVNIWYQRCDCFGDFLQSVV